MTTVATEIKLNIDSEFDVDFENKGVYKFIKNDKSVDIELGSIIADQNKNIIIPYDSKDSSIKISIEYKTSFQKDYISFTKKYDSSEIKKDLEFQQNKLRICTGSTIINQMNLIDNDNKKADLEKLLKLFTSSELLKDKYVEALYTDFKGEIKLGFEQDNYKKWGKHFLPSIARAHLLQSCNNFKGNYIL
jgi:hypothetical protein